MRWSPEIHRFSWDRDDYTIVELVYSAEVTETQEVVLSFEHTDFDWVSFDEAIEIVGKDNTKICLRKCKKLISII
jgi:8-oxo-dGTP pyrophosphatase MutT (NUDIX family)